MIKEWAVGCMIGMTITFTSCHNTHKELNSRSIVPAPLSIERTEGEFVFNANTIIAVPSENEAQVARLFTSLFTSSAGFTPQVKVAQEGDIILRLNENLKEEAYEMNVQPERIILTASTSKGFFYGLQNLRLLLPASIERTTQAEETWSIPTMTLKDEPRFGYRGFMLDVARFFMPKEDVLKLIDCMAMLKLNRLHIHLSDDNGWRLEIKKYPRLTQVGAWRVDRPGIPFPARRNPTADEKATVGGYYTQTEMKEIITYASERQIEVIPEIDIPAHSNAALASYPEYACPVVKDFIGVLPGLGGKNAEIIFCAGNDKTFTFLQDILDEVMELFPSRYVHLGGDEAAKTNWKKCPLCQRRILEEKLTDEEALQGYFMERMSAYVRSKGKEVMGWDELTNSKIPENAIIFGWQETGTAALKAAAQGHRFVMTPAKVAYLIRYQGPQWFEPLTYFGNNTLKDLFYYEPVQSNWNANYEQLLMGVQASMWTEFCASSEDVFYLVFPRLAALAEIAWIPKGERNWKRFLQGLDTYTAHLEQKGIVYAHSMFNIQHTAKPDSLGNISVSLTCERPDVTIHYTTDGSNPTASSMKYTQPITLKEATTVKAVTFIGKCQKGKTLILPIEWNKATAKTIINKAPGTEVLVNGIRGSLRQTDFEWFTGAINEEVTLTVDLGKEENLNTFTAGCVTNYSMAVHKPRRMIVATSTDNKQFNEVGKLFFSDEEIYKEGNFIDQLTINTENIKARFVKFIFEPAGNCPDNHNRPGQISKFYLDEIVIR